MPKIGKGLVNKQKATRDNSGFVTADKILNIKKHGGKWHNFKSDTIHKINILPWKITSKKDVAFRMKGDFHKEIGEWVYSLNCWIHPRIHDEKDVLCPKKNFGKPCAICDKASEKWDLYNADKTDDKKKAANALSAKLRSMYNLEILTDELRGKNSYFEASDYIFEDELLEKATECEEGEEPVAFYEIDDEEGKIVRFKRPKITRDPYKNFEFQNRKKPISKKLLDGVMKFGELVDVMTSEEVSDFFFGANYTESPEKEDETTEEEDAYEEYTEEEESENEESPEEEPEEEEEEEEEEEKPTKKSSDGKWKKCPSPKKFGVEFGEYDACDECPVEIACHKKNKSLR